MSINNEDGWDRGISSISSIGSSGDMQAHSTPDPDTEPPGPNPSPDDVPAPAHAPVQEPTTTPVAPVKAQAGLAL